MTPTIGRIVHYRLTEEEARATNARRHDAFLKREDMQRDRPGFQAHVGNSVAADEVVPMTIVRVELADTHRISGQAALDGNDSLWVTNAKEGDEPGDWFWPPRV